MQEVEEPQTDMKNQWKELRTEIEEEVLGKYGVDESKEGVYTGRGDEPQCIIKKEDYRN